MLWADPGAGAVLNSSPLAIRVELSGPIDPNTVGAGQTVQLLAVSGGVGTPVALSMTNVSTAGDELQLFPLAPLAPGHYVVQLSGDSSQGQPAIAGLNGLPLGEDAQHPDGADESFSFQVGGIDGVAGATASDDTTATARAARGPQRCRHRPGRRRHRRRPGLQPGPGARPDFPDPPDNPANQVDLYHFRISGPGQYAMLAEVFAGRIGSPLDPGMSLFELDPSTGQLVFVAGNNNTVEPRPGHRRHGPAAPGLGPHRRPDGRRLLPRRGRRPRTSPSPLEGQLPGGPGIFDPNQPGSAQNG